jgi:hypothetical protein
MSTVIVFVFEPVPELQGRTGMCVVEAALAARLIDEALAEDPGKHAGDSLRYVTGSAAHDAAAAALRESRDTLGLVSVRRVQPAAKRRTTARLEG